MTLRPCLILVTLAALTLTVSCSGGSSGSTDGGGTGPTDNPVPSISSIAPPNANAGGPGATITLTGEGFVSTSTVNWNGTGVITTETSGTELTATIPAADIAAAGAAQITVVNPTPGGGTSNPVAFTVNATGAAAIPGFVYVANSIGVSLTMGNISVFSVDPTSGSLTPILGSPFQAGAEPTSLAVDPSTRFLFEASYPQNLTPTNDISAFTINPSTGALTAVTGSPFTSGVSPLSLSVDSTGKFLYTADSAGDGSPPDLNSISEFSIDAATGALTLISQAPCVTAVAPISGLANAVVTDPVGGYLFASSFNDIVCSFSINSSGILQPVAGSPVTLSTEGTNEADPRAVAVDPSGKFLYTANYQTGDVSAFSITAGTGALNPAPGSPFSIGAAIANPTKLGIDPLGRFLYAGAFGGISGFSINTSTGALSKLAGFPFTGAEVLVPTSLVVDPSGKFLYVVSQESNGDSVFAYAIDETTGALTPVSGSPFQDADGTPVAVIVTREVP